MALISAAASKLVDETVDALTEKKQKEREADASIQADVDMTGTLSSGNRKVFSFKSASKNTVLRRGWPFKSIDCYNGDSENIDILVNQKSGMVLPVPSNAQNGDSFPNVGITSIAVVNRGSTDIDLSNLDITVSGNPSGVSRGSV